MSMRRWATASALALTIVVAGCGGGGSPLADETPTPTERPGIAPVLAAMLLEFDGATYRPVDYRSPYLHTSFDSRGFAPAAGGVGAVTITTRGETYTVDVYIHPELGGFWTQDPAVAVPNDRTLWIRWDPAA